MTRIIFNGTWCINTCTTLNVLRITGFSGALNGGQCGLMALREMGLNRWAEATSSWAFTRRAAVSQCRTVHWGGAWRGGSGWMSALASITARTDWWRLNWTWHRQPRRMGRSRNCLGGNTDATLMDWVWPRQEGNLLRVSPGFPVENYIGDGALHGNTSHQTVPAL